MAWLGTYKYRFKMLIPSGTATAALTDQASTVQFALKSGINSLDTSFIFEVIQSEYLKMAITDADGTTQLYCEVEKWDYDTANGLIHFKKPSITTGDNYYYIYFDDLQTDNTTNIGLAGSAVSQNVWDSSFDFALNYADADPATSVQDSVTSGTYPTAGSMTSADMTDGYIGRAISFDGVDDNVDISSYTGGATGSIEMLVKITPESAVGMILETYTFDGDTYRFDLAYWDNKFYLMQMDPNLVTYSGGLPIQITTESVAGVQKYDVWHHIVVISGATPNVYIDGVGVTVGTPSLSEFFTDEASVPGERTGWMDTGLNERGPIPYANMECQTLRYYPSAISEDFINASRLNMIDAFNTLIGVEFYENTVNSIPFDLYGNPVLETVYHLVLSATGFDDIVIPIESFQMSHRKDTEAYMSVVIPDLSYLDSIIERYDGLMQLYMLIGDRNDYDRDNLIMQTRIGYPKTSIGSENESITLDGYGVFGSRYLSLDLSYNSYNTYDTDTGKRRFRFPSIPYYMRVNDTITVDGVEVLVDSISYNSGGALEVSSIE